MSWISNCGGKQDAVHRQNSEHPALHLAGWYDALKQELKLKQTLSENDTIRKYSSDGVVG